MNLTQILTSNNLSKLPDYMNKSFAQNMEYLKTLNPKLFAKLTKPATTHNLFFDGKELNIMNLESKTFAFDKHTGMIATHLNLAISPLKNKNYQLYTNDLILQKLDENKIPLTAKACNKLIDLMLDSPSQSAYHLPSNFLPSFTIFGALGGIFLQILLERNVYFHSLLLFEEYIDMFRVMLYFLDLARLFEQVNSKSCFLFIENLINKEFVNTYFKSHKITNNFLRLELYLYESEKINNAREIVHEAYKINSRGWGSFDDEMVGVRNSVENFGKSYAILNLPKRINVPICVVGNGASLEELLPFIKQNLSKMIVFSCGTALKPLLHYGIKPDFQIEIERIPYLKEILELAPIGDTTLLCGSIVQPNAIALGKKAYMFMRGGSASAYMFRAKSIIEFSAPFVGNAGFALACLLAHDVLICGLDCGYIEGRSKHASNSFYGKEGKEIPKNTFEVLPNARHKVFSDALFSLSAQNMQHCIQAYSPMLVLNLGIGAFIKGARPCRVDDFDLRDVDKQSAIEELCTYFQSDYSQVFQENEFEGLYLQEVLAFRDEILRVLKTEIKSKKELFALVDLAHTTSLKKSASKPFVGILFEGSIAHLLHTLMVCALHLSSDEISDFYRRAYFVIEEGLNAMCVSYRLFVMKERASFAKMP